MGLPRAIFRVGGSGQTRVSGFPAPDRAMEFASLVLGQPLASEGAASCQTEISYGPVTTRLGQRLRLHALPLLSMP